MMADQLCTEYSVPPNARVVGGISRRSRQIDGRIDLRHGTDNSRRLIVDAKNRKRQITINDVETFRGLPSHAGLALQGDYYPALPTAVRITDAARWMRSNEADRASRSPRYKWM